METLYQNNYKLEKSIPLASNGVYGFGMIVSSNKTIYYVLNDDFGYIYVFDDNWNIATTISFPNPAYVITIGCHLYITGRFSVWKVDAQLNVLKAYNITGLPWFRGLYYNPINQLIYTVAYNLNSMQWFDLNLNFNGTISLPLKPWSIAGFSNQIFVGTTSGDILLIMNSIIVDKFNACNTRVNSILLDQFSNMITACDNSQVFLFFSNGTSRNQYISLSVPEYTGFDSKSRFVVVSYWYGVYIYK